MSDAEKLALGAYFMILLLWLRSISLKLDDLKAKLEKHEK